MSRLGRRAWTRWSLRLALAFGASELWLTIGAHVLESHGTGTAVAHDAEHRILCVGDSNTFGVGAPEGSSYPAQLQKLLAADHPGHAVVNLGVPGFTSRMTVDRLETAIGERPPECVLFLGGFNDLARSDQLLEVPAESNVTWSKKFHAWLSHSRTFRVLEASWRVLNDDVEEEEFGGSSAEKPSTLPELESLKTEKAWQAADEKVRELGDHAYFDWLVANWRDENPEHVRKVWSELRRTSLFDRVKSRLRMPVSYYEWEIAMLGHEEPPPLAVSDSADRGVVAFARFTEAYSLLRAGMGSAARAALESSCIDPNVWSQVYRDLHVAWTWLVDRDFERADREFEDVLGRDEQISPPIGIHHALGASALAWLLHATDARLTTWMERHGKAWQRSYGWSQSPDGHEWILTAEWVDAIKSGDAKLLKEVSERAKWRVAGRPHTQPLRWLLDHPGATFAQVHDGLEFGPPRISWFAPLSSFFRTMDDDEFARLSGRSFDRLAQLSRSCGFPVVVLTYLNDDEGPARRANERLRSVAAAHHWPLVDLHATHTRDELYADGKQKYFSADRGHPNEAGYALVARAVEEALVAQHLVR